MTEWMRNRIARAAELRVRGASWEAVANEVKSRPTICMTWPRRYAGEWNQAIAAERSRLLAESHILALRAVKEMLQDKDERIRLKAARLLRSYERGMEQAG